MDFPTVQNIIRNILPDLRRFFKNLRSTIPLSLSPDNKEFIDLAIRYIDQCMASKNTFHNNACNIYHNIVNIYKIVLQSTVLVFNHRPPIGNITFANLHQTKNALSLLLDLKVIPPQTKAYLFEQLDDLDLREIRNIRSKSTPTKEQKYKNLIICLYKDMLRRVDDAEIQNSFLRELYSREYQEYLLRSLRSLTSFNQSNLINPHSDLLTKIKQEKTKYEVNPVPLTVYKYDMRPPEFVLKYGFTSDGDTFYPITQPQRSDPVKDSIFISTTQLSPSKIFSDQSIALDALHNKIRFCVRSVAIKSAEDHLTNKDFKGPCRYYTNDELRRKNMIPSETVQNQKIHGKAKAYIYKILVPAGEGVDVNKSLPEDEIPRPEYHEIVIFKKIKPEQIIGYYELSATFPTKTPRIDLLLSNLKTR